MTELASLSPGSYVVAVSGGVDSASLLNLLYHKSTAYKTRSWKLVVAHADHGVREDSAMDARFVERLAKTYGLVFELGRLQLGPAASEEQARRSRYAFLRTVQQKHHAQAIVTAHHADDVVETVLINLLRGTGWRGLCSLRSHGDYERPLLNTYKKDILAYAHKHNIVWREDSTNQLTHYLRNYIRLELLPRLLQQHPRLKQQLHELWLNQCQLREAIEETLTPVYTAAADQTGLKREVFAIAEPAIADELLRHFLLAHNIRQTAPQRSRALQFIQSANNTKKFSLNARAFLQLSREHVTIVQN